MCDGQTDHRTIRQIDGTLYQSFAKRATTYYQTAVLILNGTCHNLCSRGRIAIHQDDDLTLREFTISMRLVLRALHLSTIGIDNHVTTLQKLISNIDSSFQITSTILLQIKYQILHTLCLKFCKTFHEFIVSLGTKVTNADIADTRSNHVGGIDRMDRNLISYYSKFQFILDAKTHHTQFYLRTLRTTQALHNLLLRHLHTCNRCIIHGYDTVASNDAHLLRRTFGNRLDNHQRIVHHIKLHADTLEITIQRLIEFFYLLGGRIAGMGIEFVEHALDGILHQFLFVNTIHIKVGDS